MTPVKNGSSNLVTWRPAQTPRAPETTVSELPSVKQERQIHAHRVVVSVSLGLIAVCVLAVGWASEWGQGWSVVSSEAQHTTLTLELPLPDVPLPLTDQELEPYISSVAQRSAVSPNSWHLAPGLAPPTNRWFSPLVFETSPQPVHPLPFTVAVADGGLALSIPSNAAAPTVDPVIIVDAGATSWLVSGYTDASVTLTLERESEPFAEVVLTRGSPVVGYRALVNHTVAVDSSLTRASTGVFSTSVGGATLGLVGERVSLNADGRGFTVPQGASANWVVVPEAGSLATVAPFATTTITDVAVSYLVMPDVTTTTIQFVTADDAPAVFGVFDRLGTDVTTQSGDEVDCSLGRFDTPEGRLRVCVGDGFSYRVPTVDPLAPIAFSTLPESDRVAVVQSLSSAREGVAAIPRQVAPASPELSRLATLLHLARELRDVEATTQLSTRLREELMTWAQLDGCAVRAEQCFAYDPMLLGIVVFDDPATAEMSDARLAQNGAFLYAAGVAAQGDTELITRLRPMMTLLAADIVGSQSSHFAARRAFDPVSGNSWSSCEPWLQVSAPDEPCSAPRALGSPLTVSAYSGVAVWASTAGDPWLLDQMTWMLSVEQHGSTRTE